MTGSACPDTATLAAWIDGRLIGHEHEDVCAHVRDCSACGWVVSRTSTGASPPRRRVELGVGMQLGRYRLDEELGRGAMGIVYRGYDPQLRRSVAIKVTRPPKGVDVDEYRTRLMAEAEALADADDPCVVQVYDVGRGDEGLLYIVMELVEGETARRWCEDREAPDIIAMMLAVGATLARLHDRGLVHGDIKPENLMIEADGTPRLVDFGLARAANAPQRRRRRAPGTPGYMAPEQLRGEETQATAAADQYAWATTFFEMLAGRHPFAGVSARTLSERKTLGSPAWAAMPRSRRVRAVLRRALAPKPTDRWPSMHEAIRSRSRARRIGAVFAAAGLVAAATFAVVDAPAPCPVPELDLQTGLPRIDERLATWRESWTESTRASCALEEPNRAAARACLSDARLAATAIVERLSRLPEGSSPAASAVDVAMVEDLIEPRLCLNARSLPVSSADPALELVLRRDLQRAWVEYRNHPGAETAAALEELDRRAREDDLGPVLARIRVLRGVGEREHGDPEKARELFEDALDLAREHGMDSMVADVWLHMLILEALHRRHPEEVAKTTRFLDAHLDQALDPQVLAGRRDVALALWHAERKELEQALQRSEASLAALKDAHNRNYYAEALEAAGIVRAHAGDVPEAIEWLERARSHYQRILGSGSTKEIALTSNLAAMAGMEGRWADAERLAREGLALETQTMPAFAASLHSTLGKALCVEASSPEAVEHLRRALEMRRERFDSAHQLITSARFQLALCLSRPKRGEFAVDEDALQEADALLGRVRAHIDAVELDPVFQGRITYLQGLVALHQGRDEDALRWCEEARDRLQGVTAPEDLTGSIDGCIDEARIRLGELGRARPR